MLFLNGPTNAVKMKEVERKSNDVSSSEPQKDHAPGRRAWAIKLGRGGIYIDFCEKHNIVGVGWVGTSATGQVLQFVEECAIGDYVIYLDPPRKQVRICRVLSEALYRDFDLTEPESSIDIWHYRKVEYPVPPIPIIDLHLALKGRILDPRMSFWELCGVHQTIDQIAKSRNPQIAAAADSEIMRAYATLRALVVARSEALNEKDWQSLVVDYLKAQGASAHEKEVAGNPPTMYVEARFDHGDFEDEAWLVRIIRCEEKKVDRREIEQDLELIGNACLCCVSVFGFTEQARQLAQNRGVRLLEAADFTPFLLTGKIRPSIRQRLHLPPF